MIFASNFDGLAVLIFAIPILALAPALLALIPARKGHWLAPVLATPTVLIGLLFTANLFTEGAMTIFWFVFPIPLIPGIYAYFLWFRRRAARRLPARPP